MSCILWNHQTKKKTFRKATEQWNGKYKAKGMTRNLFKQKNYLVIPCPHQLLVAAYDGMIDHPK